MARTDLDTRAWNFTLTFTLTLTSTMRCSN